VYGDVDPALTYASVPAVGSSLANGATISFIGSLARVSGENVGSYQITQGSVDNSNYAITYNNANLTITPLAVTITAAAKTKVYGDVDPALTYTSSPAVGTVLTNGHAIAFTGSLTRVAGENVGSYQINQSTLDNSNYTIGYTGANLSITPLSVTVTAAAKTKVYGDVDPALTYASVPAVGSSLANGHTISFTGSLSRLAGENVGSYAIGQGTVDNSNYTIGYTAANLSITSLSVTVTAAAKTKVYGDVDPALTYASVPAVGSSLANGHTISFTGSLSRLAGENVGSYAIGQGTVANSNYTIGYTGANLNITPLSVTVTAAAKTKVYGDVDPALTYASSPAVSTVLANGHTISFTGSLARLSGENVGNYAISQGTVANSNYTIAYTGANLGITPLSVTVTAALKSKVYGDVDPALTYTSVPAVGSTLANGATISFTGSLARLSGESVGNYAINQGTVANSNYTIGYTSANLGITTLSVTVTAAAKTKVYGDVDPALTYASVPAVGSSLANGATISFTGSLARASGENIGNYAINQGTVNNSNYAITYSSADLTIGVRPITVTADNQSKFIGTADPALTYQITSGSLAFTDAFTGDLSRTTGEAAGAYAILQGSLALTANYNLSYIGANLVIGKRPTTLLYTGQQAVQYSDEVTLSAHLTDISGATPSISLAGRTIRFQVGSQSTTATTNAIGAATTVLKVTQKPTVVVPVSVYSVRDTFFTDMDYLGSTDLDTFRINKEDAFLEYNGIEYFSTPNSSTSTGQVILSGYIKDDSDGVYTRGAITNSNVIFKDFTSSTGTSLGAAPYYLVPSLMNSAVFTEGIVQTSFTGTVSGGANSSGTQYKVVMQAGEYYEGESEQRIVTLAYPGQDYVSGGGHVNVGTTSIGTYAATAGSKMNFGLNMKWNNSGKNLQGQINILFRRLVNGQWRTYQIKSNAINSMAISNGTGFRQGNISTKATLTDVTDPLLPATLTGSGGSDLSLTVYESTTITNGSADKISVMYSNTTGTGSAQTTTVLFANNWVGSGNQLTLLNGGKIKVRNPTLPPRMIDPNGATIEKQLDVKVYPNPSNGTFNLELPNTDQKVRIVVTDVSGKMVAMENINEDHSQTIRLDLKNVSAGVYLLQVNNGEEVYRTKLIVQ
jgi:hypothetical protein